MIYIIAILISAVIVLPIIAYRCGFARGRAFKTLIDGKKKYMSKSDKRKKPTSLKYETLLQNIEQYDGTAKGQTSL